MLLAIDFADMVSNGSRNRAKNDAGAEEKRTQTRCPKWQKNTGKVSHTAKLVTSLFNRSSLIFQQIFSDCQFRREHLHSTWKDFCLQRQEIVDKSLKTPFDPLLTVNRADLEELCFLYSVTLCHHYHRQISRQKDNMTKMRLHEKRKHDNGKCT